MSRVVPRERQSDLFSDPREVSRHGAAEIARVSVRVGYERWARTYDYTPNPLLALEERYLMPLLPVLTEKNVLDVACGTGRWLAQFMARGAGLGVGIDLSPAMLRAAARKPAVSSRLVLADCLQLPFRPMVFDFVMCSFVLNHIQDVRAMACELGRVMKPEGRLLICELHPEAHARGWRPGFRDLRGAVQVETLHHSSENVVDSFQPSGFECRELHTLFFGEPERRIFQQARKEELFADACRVPAVQVYDFRNLGCR